LTPSHALAKLLGFGAERTVLVANPKVVPVCLDLPRRAMPSTTLASSLRIRP
jgi:hypothetical protein